MNIERIQEPVISEYFFRLHVGDFAGAAALFSASGCLYPPFEKSICGRTAIQDYLQTEFRGMQAVPQSVTELSTSADGGTYLVTGQVKVNCFTLQVAWSIRLNAEREISCVEVKLLNELHELLNWKPSLPV